MKRRFTHTFMLLIFQLRQKWLWLCLWLIGITAFASGYVSAFEKIAEDQGMCKSSLHYYHHPTFALDSVV